MRKIIGVCEIYAILLETWKLSGHDNQGRITPQKHYPIAQTLHFPHLVQRGYHLLNVKTSCHELRALIIVLYLSKNHKQAFSQYVPYKICKVIMAIFVVGHFSHLHHLRNEVVFNEKMADGSLILHGIKLSLVTFDLNMLHPSRALDVSPGLISNLQNAYSPNP